MYDNNFNKVLEQANKKYQSKKSKYGESWKKMSIIELDERFSEEVSEFQEASSRKEMYEESLDILNVILMIAERLRTFDKLSKQNETEK